MHSREEEQYWGMEAVAADTNFYHRRLFVNHTCGIDWASDHHDVSIVNEHGMEVKKFRIEDTLVGYQELLGVLKTLGGDIPVAIECKEHLLISFLIGEGYMVYPINPKSADRYKDRYNVAGTKTDPVDAFALADILRTDRHKHHPLAYSSEEVQRLQLLCGEYDKLLKNKNILEGQLFDVLSKYFPLALTLFSSNSCKILYRLILGYPTYKKLKTASFDGLSRFLKNSHYLFPKNIAKIYQKIQKSEYYHNDIFDDVLSVTAIGLSRVLLAVTEQVEMLKKKMSRITSSHVLGPIFSSLPGGGAVMSSKLLALMGDNRELYADPAQVQAYTGVAPIIKRSGKMSRVVFRFACNKTHRDTLTWFAFCSMPHCSWAREFYDRKREEGKRHYEACRLLAFKWVRIIFQLWKHGHRYNEEVHVGYLNRFQKRRLKIA
jgi:transposase